MNRRNFALAGLASLPATTASVLAKPDATASRDTHQKRKIVTRTFSNPRTIKIPGASNESEGPAAPYPSTITVSGLRQGRILDVNLTLHGFSHTYAGDVNVMLVAPNGRAALVMCDTGGSGDPVVNLVITLDDQAAEPLPELEDLVSGTFRPANYDDGSPDGGPAPAPQGVTETALATFRGINPNGPWKLFVHDENGGDTGSIKDGWSLTIRARVTTRE